jgi:hypothetical protein
MSLEIGPCRDLNVVYSQFILGDIETQLKWNVVRETLQLVMPTNRRAVIDSSTDDFVACFDET